jgi:hypothetical protein
VEKAKKNNVKIVFPVDYITADKFDKDAAVSVPRSEQSFNLILLDRRGFGKRWHTRRMDGSRCRSEKSRTVPKDHPGS